MRGITREMSVGERETEKEVSTHILITSPEELERSTRGGEATSRTSQLLTWKEVTIPSPLVLFLESISIRVP